ncbi:DUF947-domain-containing protein [Tricholoma matsutake]|nr:DUF947-domain-containing protein [Tricholoma matsutake 945]
MFSKSNGNEGNDVLDSPRVAQWEDEESEVDEPTFNELEQNQLVDLSDLPLGILRRAQQFVSQNEANPEDSDTGDEDESLDDGTHTKDRGKQISEPNSKHRFAITKRWNKHAPTEITSKKPVTRKRAIIEVEAVQSRDPRFLPLAGELSTENFRARYSFLADAHEAELDTLRENLKRARKLLATSPRDLFYERDQEVKRLELAVKRAESMVNKDSKDKTEREALLKLTREEKEKRKQGKRHWWLKESEKRDVLVQARYEALAAGGGKGAVKRAIAKKQKKVGQKEKKSRPFPRGAFSSIGEHSRQQISEGDSRGEGQSSGKRRRVAK